MVRELKQTSIFGGMKYKRGKINYSRKEDAIKDAKRMKKMGINVVRDKNSKGHFLWTHIKPKSKLTKKEAEERYIEMFTEPIKHSKEAKKELRYRQETYKVPRPKAKPKPISVRFKGGMHHRNRSDAQEEMSAWKGKGYDAQIREARSAGMLTYRVYRKKK